jgi:hypothetical protein
VSDKPAGPPAATPWARAAAAIAGQEEDVRDEIEKQILSWIAELDAGRNYTAKAS